MDPAALRKAQALARDCALALMENAGFILKELPASR